MFKSNSKYEILTDNGFSDFDGIQIVERDRYIHLYFNDQSDIRVSFDHVFFINGNDISALSLKIGDKLDHINGYLKIVNIKKIYYINKKVKLYDPINVKNGYRYYSNGILSHNCDFLGSSSTVIDSDVLESLQSVYKEPLLYDLSDKLRVYEKPIPGAVYVIGNDVAKGTGRHYSTCQVLKVLSTNPLKLEQVCVYQNNFIDVYKFSSVISKLSYYYNNAYLMVENNADGAAVVTQLWWELENENLINSGGKAKDLGIRATKNTKPKAVLFMKKLIEDRKLSLVDHNTIMELNDFVDKGNSRYGANNYDDDLVSALYWAVYIFLMDILDDIDFMKNEKKESEDDVWGILSDIDEYHVDENFNVIL